MRLPLVGGSYSARSIIASAQKCINLYPEVNPRGSIVPLTHYQRPGLSPITTIGNGPIRGLYRASNGVGYVVSGSEWFLINPDFTTTRLGSITPGITNPVSMIDNGFQIMLVDGSSNGWLSTLGQTDFKVIVDPTGTFTGADRVDTVDTYILWNIPGGQFFGSTDSNQIEPFEPTFIAGKTAYPDNLITLIVNRREIILLGSLKSEVWANVGAALFPFAEVPGYYIEHGIVAKYSVASQDISTYWLSQDLQGQGIVLRFRGYQTQRVSNHAIEFAIGQMSRIDDAIGMTFQKDGHIFYMLTFPTGDQTWVYDSTIEDPLIAWHQEAWTDSDGLLHRSRVNCHALINGKNTVGDWQNNTLYELDLNAYTDTVNGLEGPITCIRTFPRIGSGRLAGGNQVVEADGRRLQFSAFRADIECGLGPVMLDGLPAQISLRWSDDRGRTFGSSVLQSTGQPGEYITQPQWLGLGVARERIFEISHSIAGSAALNGAWVDCEILGT